MMEAINKIIGWMPALIQSTGVTLALSVTSVLAALVFAVFLALGKISRNAVLSKVCGAYIFFFRGTPLLMQLFFIYYTLPQMIPALNIQSRFFAAWLAFTLNVAAYLARSSVLLSSPSTRVRWKLPAHWASPVVRLCVW